MKLETGNLNVQRLDRLFSNSHHFCVLLFVRLVSIRVDSWFKFTRGYVALGSFVANPFSQPITING